MQFGPPSSKLDLERDAEKWTPVFRPHPALHIGIDHVSRLWTDLIQSHRAHRRARRDELDPEQADMRSEPRTWTTPREGDLGLATIESPAGLLVSVLPNGCLFAIEHRGGHPTIVVNQIYGSPIDGGIARLVLRIGGPEPMAFEIVGPNAEARFGTASDRMVWEGEAQSVRHRVTLALQPRDAAWMWTVEVENSSSRTQAIDAILVQDIGLGERSFLMNNEAYASQYIDHHIARHERYGPVPMNRQNLDQSGRHPWVAHGCLDGACGFATDAMQLFGPQFRGSDRPRFLSGARLPNEKLQHELACIAVQSRPVTLAPSAGATWRFFGVFDPDHASVSSDADLARIEALRWEGFDARAISTAAPVRSQVRDAPIIVADPLDGDVLAQFYPDRLLEEHAGDDLMSFFVPDPPHNRHVVLARKEPIVTRRHGAILRSGRSMLPDDATLCTTCWMHGVFAAQLTIGNTSFHKLLSVSRDPYNIMRANGLRMLLDCGDGWHVLAVPSAFEMGLSDCRWIYRLGGRTIVVHAMTAGDDAALQLRVGVEGEPCRFLVYGHVVLGERELDCASPVELDDVVTGFRFLPEPDSLWGRHYPDAAYRLVIGTPDAIEAIGGDELLYADGKSRGGAYVTLLTRPTQELRFTIVGSMTDRSVADRLAEKYRAGIADRILLASAKAYWSEVTRGLRITGGSVDGTALDIVLPWFAHDAMIHLTVPHGLEQYTGAAWGTRDVCQGPLEFLLALEHDATAKDILRIVLAQQYEHRGDWPQWFMLDPYAFIQDRHSHGDVVVWPLKALNDYLEATNDLGFLDEAVAWRDDGTLLPTPGKVAVTEHVEKLLATVRERFIPGTNLVRYGEGDWNDSLQPADPTLRDNMVSSWTVALLYQQLVRYAAIMQSAGRSGTAETTRALAEAMRNDFDRYLVRDGTVAGYAIFFSDRDRPELVIHPSDTRTGLRYSLLPMTRSIIGGLFTPEQAQHHLRLIREHLLLPDGARLLDRPVAYHGGLQTTFRRAESAAFFGREIGLMYVHAHLRYAEAMAVLQDADALLEALRLANPVVVGDRLATALPRQRNSYFSSSDAAYPDRAAASAEWSRLKESTIGFEAGWRIYSSGPGIYTSILIRDLLGRRRTRGTSTSRPLLPASIRDLHAEPGTLA
jgi:cellobiose phosphorylase